MATFKEMRKDDLDNRSSKLFAGIQTSNITSRDQIIDPYSLVRVADYGNNRVDRAQYEQDLAQAIRLSEMQEASYQEWYNSESQQVARQKVAGLNPDLNGNIESGTASDVAVPSGSPMAGIPMNAEIAMNAAQIGLGALSAIGGVFGSVASIMGTISQIGLNSASETLTNEQIDAQQLANMASFENLAHKNISDSLANAISTGGAAFDIAKFFSDDNNFSPIFTSIAPEDNERYRNAFNRIRNNSREVFSDAYSTLGKTEEGRKTYLGRLASNFYDPNDDVMTGQLKIMVGAQERLNLLYADLEQEIIDIKKRYMSNIDVDRAAAGFNSNTESAIAYSDFNTDYYNAMNGEIIAKWDVKKKIADGIIADTTSEVYSWLNRNFSWSFGQKKQLAGWQILAGAHMGWQDYLTASNDKRMQIILNQIRNLGDASMMNAESNRMNATTNRGNLGINALNAAGNVLNGIGNIIPL